MKRTLLFFASICLVVSSAMAASDPTGTIRSFYHWYVTEVAATHDPLSNHSTMARYISERFLKEVEAQRKSSPLGADPFINAQDVDDSWAKNIIVSHLLKKGEGMATADVLLKGKTKEMQQHLKVSLVNERGDWKIDSVEPKD